MQYHDVRSGYFIDSLVLLKGVNQVMHLCHRQYSLRSSNLPDNGNSEPAMSLPPMSSAQHICKVVLELVDTERSYVRVSHCKLFISNGTYHVSS